MERSNPNEEATSFFDIFHELTLKFFKVGQKRFQKKIFYENVQLRLSTNATS